jgi:phosphate-transporting ATPase
VRGPSGSGKTLFLRAVADLDPNDGEIHLDGQSRFDMSGPTWRQRVRYLAAEPGWWAETVAEHFHALESALATALALGLPQQCMDWRVDRLSTGERQRLAIVRALEDRPRVLLLDEPTAALDQQAVGAVETLIRDHIDGGTCVLLVTHSRGQAVRLARRHFSLENGTLVPSQV